MLTVVPAEVANQLHAVAARKVVSCFSLSLQSRPDATPSQFLISLPVSIIFCKLICCSLSFLSCSLLEYCQSPVPLLAGIHTSYLAVLDQASLGDSVWVDLDMDEVVPFVT